MEEILEFFPELLKYKILSSQVKEIEEIRIRLGKPVILKNNTEDKVLDYITSAETILKILQKICNNSLYSYQNQICEGYITLKGGHRVGITGNAVMKDGNIINLNYISSLNFRISRQVIGCGNEAITYILNSNRVWNTLIASPPRNWKNYFIKRYNQAN